MEFLSYLEKDYMHLHGEIKEFNDQIFISPHSAIIKGRIFLEKLLQNVARVENYAFINVTSQDEKLKELVGAGILQLEPYTLFDTVRRIGNKAAHTKIEGELEAALNIHKNIYKLIGWFIQVYIDPFFEIPAYSGLVPPEDNVMEMNEEMIAEVLKRILRDEVAVTKMVPKDEGLDRKCLVQELSRLRESSKEAVEGLVEFTKFKEYMHIEREAQLKLHTLIAESSKSEKSQLILVSGSVGDGKSHIISYFKNKYPDIISDFILHNDATESLEPSMTSTDTLNELLNDFSDEKIEASQQKIILAINLGTLNNFIDSEYGARFSILKQYVHDKKIIETSIKYNGFDENSFFQFINFSDYHIFTLKDGKVHSDYIKTLISKVTSSTELNPFYKSYKNNCCECNSRNSCPVKWNYEFLSQEKVQQSVVDLLVQCVIKNKMIISTRALLNFIYELLVPIIYIDTNSPTLKSDVLKMGNTRYIRALMPNIIFNHKELSFIFEGLNGLDPLDVRNKEIDNFIIGFNNSVDIAHYFEEYIDFPQGYIKELSDMQLLETEAEGEKTRYELLKLFIRSYDMCGNGNLFSLKDYLYEEYMKNIYFWNQGEKGKLIELYDNVKSGILRWNGDADKDQINIFIGNNQTKYKVSQDIELQPDISNLPQSREKELKKFATTLKLQYKGAKSEESYSIDIDFSLYRLLGQINKGYRPNKKDKNQFINFIEFINKLEETGSQKQRLIFTEKNKENNKKYKLEYDSQFDFYRFMETSI